jgi:anti-sigma regulatory factor (Ser/Thr protein kinase)
MDPCTLTVDKVVAPTDRPLVALAGFATERPAHTSLHLESPPDVRLVSSARVFIEELCSSLVDASTSSRVALTAHELMENLSKYSETGPTDVTVQVGEREGQTRVIVRTRNRTTPEQRHELMKVLEVVCSAAEPMTMYLEVIARSIERDQGSGLGLARIRAEAGMKLTYSISGDEVTIQAETGVEPG